VDKKTRSEVMALLAKRNNPQQNQLSRTGAGWDPFEVMNELLTPFFNEMSGTREFFPSFDVKETRDSYLFKGDLPGIKQSDVDVSLNGNRLTISGQREEEKRDQGEQYYAHERSYGSFVRTFTLPEDIDSENVNAEFTDGVLMVKVPKKAAAQPRKIELKSGVTQGMGSKQISAKTDVGGMTPGAQAKPEKSAKA